MTFAERARDPRTLALFFGGGMVFGVGEAARHQSLVAIVIAAALGAVVFGLLALVSVREWQDPKHSAWTGAGILFMGLVAAAVVAYLLA